MGSLLRSRTPRFLKALGVSSRLPSRTIPGALCLGTLASPFCRACWWSQPYPGSHAQIAQNLDLPGVSGVDTVTRRD